MKGVYRELVKKNGGSYSGTLKTVGLYNPTVFNYCLFIIFIKILLWN